MTKTPDLDICLDKFKNRFKIMKIGVTFSEGSDDDEKTGNDAIRSDDVTTGSDDVTTGSDDVTTGSDDVTGSVSTEVTLQITTPPSPAFLKEIQNRDTPPLPPDSEGKPFRALDPPPPEKNLVEGHGLCGGGGR